MQKLLNSMPFGSRGLVTLIVVILIAAVSIFWVWARGRVEQPIAFNHRLHTGDLGIQCSECHIHYLEGTRSGLPDAETCMMCHAEALTESLEEARLIEMHNSDQPVAFRKLFHMPAHVYYSHRRHAVAAQIECTTCHGDIANTETPPTRPLITVDMDFCMNCHTQGQVNNDCKSCHR